MLNVKNGEVSIQKWTVLVQTHDISDFHIFSNNYFWKYKSYKINSVHIGVTNIFAKDIFIA